MWWNERFDGPALACLWSQQQVARMAGTINKARGEGACVCVCVCRVSKNGVKWRCQAEASIITSEAGTWFPHKSTESRRSYRDLRHCSISYIFLGFSPLHFSLLYVHCIMYLEQACLKQASSHCPKAYPKSLGTLYFPSQPPLLLQMCVLLFFPTPHHFRFLLPLLLLLLLVFFSSFQSLPPSPPLPPIPLPLPLDVSSIYYKCDSIRSYS